MAALLEDGLQRAYADPDIGPWMQQRMQLQYVSSLEGIAACASDIDVVYLDPMYPHKTKSALVKKEMQVFQSLVGEDADADGLLAPALKLAQKRVVVKRPGYAAPLDHATTCAISNQKNRFDVSFKAVLSLQALKRLGYQLLWLS